MNRIQNSLNVFFEPEFKHLVRLIQHDSLDWGEVDIASFDVVEYAARRAYEDFEAALECADLGFDWHASIHCLEMELVGRVFEVLKGLGDLDCELSCWG